MTAEVASSADDLRALRELVKDFRQRAEQTVVALDDGGQHEDECDSPAECHAAAQHFTWKLAARALEKLISSPGWGSAVTTRIACADGPTCPEHGDGYEEERDPSRCPDTQPHDGHNWPDTAIRCPGRLHPVEDDRDRELAEDEQHHATFNPTLAGGATT